MKSIFLLPLALILVAAAEAAQTGGAPAGGAPAAAAAPAASTAPPSASSDANAPAAASGAVSPANPQGVPTTGATNAAKPNPKNPDLVPGKANTPRPVNGSTMAAPNSSVSPQPGIASQVNPSTPIPFDANNPNDPNNPRNPNSINNPNNPQNPTNPLNVNRVNAPALNSSPAVSGTVGAAGSVPASNGSTDTLTTALMQFDLMDAQHRGFITADEIAVRPDADRLRSCDANHDSRVSREEFSACGSSAQR
jgi:hypothetical protein